MQINPELLTITCTLGKSYHIYQHPLRVQYTTCKAQHRYINRVWNTRFVCRCSRLITVKNTPHSNPQFSTQYLPWTFHLKPPVSEPAVCNKLRHCEQNNTNNLVCVGPRSSHTSMLHCDEIQTPIPDTARVRYRYQWACDSTSDRQRW